MQARVVVQGTGRCYGHRDAWQHRWHGINVVALFHRAERDGVAVLGAGAQGQVLLDAIRNDTPHNEARRAGEAEIAALMGRMATHTGQFVTWDQAKDSSFQFVKDIDNMNWDTEAPIQEGSDGL